MPAENLDSGVFHFLFASELSAAVMGIIGAPNPKFSEILVSIRQQLDCNGADDLISMQNQPAKTYLGFNWQISPNSGWGVLGFNLAVEAENSGHFAPVPLLSTIHTSSFPKHHQVALERILARERIAAKILAQNPEDHGIFRCEFPVLDSLGNRIANNRGASFNPVLGAPHLGIIFLEDTEVTPEDLITAREYNLILAGSTWNTRVLQKNQVSNVETFIQGIDPEIFFPKQKQPPPHRPFIIFSGGKLEFRKGQDLVIAAFRKFRQRQPNAILATAWHNPWPKTMETIGMRGHVHGFPARDNANKVDMVSWLQKNGVPRQNCHDYGPIPNHLMPSAYAQADVALFANRCEGGTNLVAMECMACGIPTILSANTGHLDLIDDRHCYPLHRQSPVQPVPSFSGTEGWGESDVEEIVENLERVYADRQEAERRGAAAARFMANWTWAKRYQQLVTILDTLR